MEKPLHLRAKDNVDLDAECLYRYVYGADDFFNPHTHDFYEILVTISGTFTHLVNGVIQKLPEGSLVFMRPNDVHSFLYDTPKSKNTAFINLTFTTKTAECLFSFLSESFPSHELLSCDMPPSVLLTSIEKKRLLNQISELNAVNWQDKNALKLRMRAILCDIFVRFFYNMPKNISTQIPSWLVQLSDKMKQPENFIAGMDRMVELSQKSREHLSRSLKKYMGLSVTQYINELRINYASNLLLKTNTPVLTICFDCGFQSLSYFYKVFSAKYNMSPSEFRKIYK